MTRVQINTDDLVSVPEAASILNRPKITLYRWIEKRTLVAIELGGVLFVPRAEVDRLLQFPESKTKGAASLD